MANTLGFDDGILNLKSSLARDRAKAGVRGRFCHCIALAAYQECGGMRFAGAGASDECVKAFNPMRKPVLNQEIQCAIRHRRL